MFVTFARVARRLPNLVLVGALASCSGDLPNSAFVGGPGERGYSACSSAMPIVKLIYDRDIRTPDEASAVPMLEQVRRELAKSDPDGTFAGITYDLAGGNSLPTQWLVQ